MRDQKLISSWALFSYQGIEISRNRIKLSINCNFCSCPLVNHLLIQWHLIERKNCCGPGLPPNHSHIHYSNSTVDVIRTDSFPVDVGSNAAQGIIIYLSNFIPRSSGIGFNGNFLSIVS